MAENNDTDVLEASKAAAAAAAQGVKPGDGNNDTNNGNGNGTPDPASNKAPEPTAEEKAATEAKATEEAKTKEAEAASAKAAEEAAAKDKETAPLDTDVWGSTGDDIGDSVLEMLQNADVTPEDAKSLLWDAVQAGDVTKIDTAALEAKVGKAKATLIMAGVTTYVTTQTARNAQIVSDIKEASGGEENWAKMTAWTKGKNAEGKPNVPDADLVEYRGMIDKGGAMARFAVSEIAAKFNADPANTTLQTATVTAPIQGDGGKGQTARATSRAEYVAELTKAHRENVSDAVLDEITAARRLGRAQGK